MKTCSKPDYKEQLKKELDVMGNSEMWQAGKACRALRPHDKAHANAATAAGTRGRGNAN
jgi:ketol-acid reductoisomerase